MQDEIVRLRSELTSLGGRERGLLGEVDHIAAELRLTSAEAREVNARLELGRRAIEAASARGAALARDQAARARYLGFRLREIYKRGSQQALQRWLAEEPGADVRAALDTLSFLSERDGRILAEWEADAAEMRANALRLKDEQSRLLVIQREAERARLALEEKREAQARLLESIQRDRDKRVSALSELEAAALDLGLLVDRLGPGEPPSLDMRKFRGLLDWPVEGRISASFGTAIHPRFRTSIPHPGVDIDAAEGTPFRCIFDGRVAYASWLRGYGLTVLVDHGGGAVSVYAHAAALLVEKGEEVTRGQVLGQVGDTGSLRGPYLYFEVRRAGKAEDPSLWLRSK